MSGIFWSSFDKSKLKSHLLMALERFKLQTNRRRNEIQAEKREIAVLLRDKHFDRARIKVESVIRKDRERQACEVLETMVDLIATRVTLIAAEKACSADMVESVQTVMWASRRLQVDELHVVREQLGYKYGDAFAAAAMKGEGPSCHVNPRIIELLTVSVPPDDVKLHYLTEIAAAQNVPFNPGDMVTATGTGKPSVLPAMLPSALGPPPSTELPCCGGGAGSDTPPSGGAGCCDGPSTTLPGAPVTVPTGGGKTATFINNADGSTTIVVAPTGTTVLPTVPAPAAGGAGATGGHGHGHGDHHGHGGGGGMPMPVPVPSASGLPPGVILDPFSATGTGMPYGAGGGFPGASGMPVPPGYGGFPYGAPTGMPPTGYYPGGYPMPVPMPMPVPVGVTPSSEAGFPDGKPPAFLAGAAGLPSFPSPTNALPAVVASPGYTYGTMPSPSHTQASAGPTAPTPSSTSTSAGSPVGGSASVHSASASVSRVTGVLNPEEDGGDSAADGGSRHTGGFSHPSAHRIAMPPTHTSGTGASPAASAGYVSGGGYSGAASASDPDMPSKAGSSAPGAQAAGASSQAAPSMESLAARFAALRASRE